MYLTITDKRLAELLACEKQLHALEAAGVDNWEGYEIAMQEEDEDE